MKSKRQPNLREVARAAGVSLNAASLALRNDPQLPPATRERIQAVAADMGYQRNAAMGELMRQMRLRGNRKTGASFALINANADEQAFVRHPTLPRYVAGIRRRAEAGGYHLDPFWLHAPGMRPERWREIFTARGLRGALIVGMMQEKRLPDTFRGVPEQFPSVVTGLRTEDPELSYASVDHHALLHLALREARSLGYRRPALALSTQLDELVMGRFSAGFRHGVETLYRMSPLPVFDDRRNDGEFLTWFCQTRPDVVLSLFNRPARLIREQRLAAATVQLELRPEHNDVAGIDQRNDLVGEAAFDLLVSALLQGETGLPQFAKGVLISPVWRAGASAPMVPVT